MTFDYINKGKVLDLIAMQKRFETWWDNLSDKERDRVDKRVRINPMKEYPTFYEARWKYFRKHFDRG
jgi:hypothetical protein